MFKSGKLMKASAWGQREFEEGSVPDNRTIKRWIEIGKLKGKVIDGGIWVNSSERWGVETAISSLVHQMITEA